MFCFCYPFIRYGDFDRRSRLVSSIRIPRGPLEYTGFLIEDQRGRLRHRAGWPPEFAAELPRFGPEKFLRFRACLRPLLGTFVVQDAASTCPSARVSGNSGGLLRTLRALRGAAGVFRCWAGSRPFAYAQCVGTALAQVSAFVRGPKVGVLFAWEIGRNFRLV